MCPRLTDHYNCLVLEMNYRYNIIGISNYLLGLMAVSVLFLGRDSQIIDFSLVVVFSSIFVLLYIGNKIVRKRVIEIFQVFFLLYVVMSYVIPFIASVSIPLYVDYIKDFTLHRDDQERWILMALYDCISIQISIILAQAFVSKQRITLPKINLNRASVLVIAMILLTLIFRIYFNTGKYVDGEMAANPISQILQPNYIIYIVIMAIAAIQYKHLNHIYEYGIREKLLVFFLAIVWLSIEVYNGSRSGILWIFLLSMTGLMLNRDTLSRKGLIMLGLIVVLSVPAYVFSTFMKDTGVELVAHFFRGNDIFSGIWIAISQRVGLLDNLFQISNETYNLQIYKEIGFFQVIKSTFDLIMPGTYFPGVYSQSALNQVWLYDYNVSDIATGWSSISVSLYATNYLYFGMVGSFFVTGFVNFLYIITTSRLILLNSSSFGPFMGAFLMFSYQPMFLTSFGYEYLVRWVVFGVFHIYLWTKLLTYKKIKE